MAQYKCMLCGQWHKGDSQIIKKHVHEYYSKGGTIPLSEWEKRDMTMDGGFVAAAKSIERRGTKGKFTAWCKSHGYNGVTNECISKALAAGGHAAQMAKFAKGARTVAKDMELRGLPRIKRYNLVEDGRYGTPHYSRNSNVASRGGLLDGDKGKESKKPRTCPYCGSKNCEILGERHLAPAYSRVFCKCRDCGKKFYFQA